MAAKIEKTDEQWRAELSPEQYAICRCSDTERAFTGKYWNHHATGTYVCAACRADAGRKRCVSTPLQMRSTRPAAMRTRSVR